MKPSPSNNMPSHHPDPYKARPDPRLDLPPQKKKSLEALLKTELPDDAAKVQTVVNVPKLESLASPQKAPRKITWTDEDTNLCMDDPYTNVAEVPTCSSVDGALHRLGTDDIEECVYFNFN